MRELLEVTGGVFETPEEGRIVLPPENCGRKDIEEGLLVIKTVETPQDLAKTVARARKSGITEISAGSKPKDEGMEL